MRTKQVTLTTSFPAGDDTRMKLYSLSNVTGVPVSKLTRDFINSGLKEKNMPQLNISPKAMEIAKKLAIKNTPKVTPDKLAENLIQDAYEKQK